MQGLRRVDTNDGVQLHHGNPKCILRGGRPLSDPITPVSTMHPGEITHARPGCPVIRMPLMHPLQNSDSRKPEEAGKRCERVTVHLVGRHGLSQQYSTRGPCQVSETRCLYPGSRIPKFIASPPRSSGETPTHPRGLRVINEF